MSQAAGPERGPERGQDLQDLQQRLADLEERPVGEHPDVLESVHGTLAGELDRLVIPRAEARERHGSDG